MLSCHNNGPHVSKPVTTVGLLSNCYWSSEADIFICIPFSATQENLDLTSPDWMHGVPQQRVCQLGIQ